MLRPAESSGFTRTVVDLSVRKKKASLADKKSASFSCSSKGLQQSAHWTSGF